MTAVVFPDQGSIMGECFAVYNERGCGFIEAVCDECLEAESTWRAIPFVHEPRLSFADKEEHLRRTCSPDFTGCRHAIVELKACAKPADEDGAQVLNDSRAAHYDLGMLVNFGHHPGSEDKRVAQTSRPVETQRLWRN